MTMMILAKALETLVMPPMSLYLAIAAGFAVSRLAKRTWLRRAGIASAVLGALGLLLLTIPYVAFGLLNSLQKGIDPIAPTASTIDAEAIVVLSGDVDCDPPEYGPDQPGALSMQRSRYGAALARRTGLPLLITGGVLRPDRRPVSHVLRDFVQDELSVAVRWTEDRSVDTRGNARFSAEILKDAGIERVAVVTHAWHMPRAKRAFERAGLTVLPAPTIASTGPSGLRDGLIPSGRALRDSTWAIHEWIGRAWYWLRD